MIGHVSKKTKDREIRFSHRTIFLARVCTPSVLRYNAQSAPHRMHQLISNPNNLTAVVLEITLLLYDTRTHYNTKKNIQSAIPTEATRSHPHYSLTSGVTICTQII